MRQILSGFPFFNRLVTPSVVSSVTPNCAQLGQQEEPACVQHNKCSHCFESRLGDIGLNADVHMVSGTFFPPFHFISLHFIPYSLGVEPVVTHRTSWLESTGVLKRHNHSLLPHSTQDTASPPLLPSRPPHPFLINPAPSLPLPTSTDQSFICPHVQSLQPCFQSLTNAVCTYPYAQEHLSWACHFSRHELQKLQAQSL